MATKFYKRPITVEAVQWDGDMTTAEKFGVTECSQDLLCSALYIETLEGTMTANVGDWIIKGVKGEFYPCKPDIFAEIYTSQPSPDLLAEAVELLKDCERVFNNHNFNNLTPCEEIRITHDVEAFLAKLEAKP